MLVQGDWEEGRARDAAKADDQAEDSEEDLFGDFEDVETGQKFGADGDEATATALQAIQDEAQAQRRSEKAAKKSVFDSEYDTGDLLKGFASSHRASFPSDDSAAR